MTVNNFYIALHLLPKSIREEFYGAAVTHWYAEDYPGDIAGFLTLYADHIQETRHHEPKEEDAETVILQKPSDLTCDVYAYCELKDKRLRIKIPLTNGQWKEIIRVENLH